jgi:hypothetical protein
MVVEDDGGLQMAMPGGLIIRCHFHWRLGWSPTVEAVTRWMKTKVSPPLQFSHGSRLVPFCALTFASRMRMC